MDVKSAFLYGKIEEEVYVCQPPGFEDPYFLNRVYKVEKALYRLHQAPRAWYETFSTYLLNNGFKRGKIDKTLFIRRDKGDIKCELIFFLGLQVKQKNDGIFISQDKYVTEILKKFGFTDVKTASTPMETQKLLLKDKDGEDSSYTNQPKYFTSSCCKKDLKIGSLQQEVVNFFGSRLISWQCKKQTVVANSTTEAEYVAASSCCRQVLLIQNQLLDCGHVLAKPAESEGFEKIVDFLNAHTIKYALTVNPAIYTSCIEQFWATVKEKTVNGELQALVDGKKIIVTEASIRSDLQLNGEEDKVVYEERDDSLERAATTATSLDAEQDRGNIDKTQSKATPNEPSSLGTSSGGGPRFNPNMVRNIDDIDKDAEITLVDETQGSIPTVSTASTIPVSAASITDVEITLAQALAELKSAKPTTATSTRSKAIGLAIHKQEQAPTPIVSSQQPSREEIEADQLLAERLQAREQEELTIEERAILFQQLLEKKRKHFEAKRAEEKRNRPPIKAQQRSIMCSYLKNMEGWKPKDLKSKTFANIQELFDKAMKMVNTFVNYRTELVEGSSKKVDAEIAQKSSSKRAEDELEQESIKKQKVDEDKETAELKSLMEVIPDEEEVAVNVIPLATKPPSIVDWKIYKEGKKSYYQIIMADGSSKMYLMFSHMLKSFDREDLETLYKLVKAKYRLTRPVEDLDSVLYGDLKTMFDPHVEDQVWKNQTYYKVLEWKLYDSCGVHSLRKQNVHIHMLVEKIYPLTAPKITNMLNKKLKADHWNEMCYQLLKLITKQLKNQ
ncbi:putative ribonuclease H-like domain-containing protein [Tanacetum coccineum]